MKDDREAYRRVSRHITAAVLLGLIGTAVAGWPFVVTYIVGVVLGMLLQAAVYKANPDGL